MRVRLVKLATSPNTKVHWLLTPRLTRCGVRVQGFASVWVGRPRDVECRTCRACFARTLPGLGAVGKLDLVL